MKAFCINIILLISFLSSVFGQEISFPDIKKAGTTIDDFVPEGWAVLAVSYGDVNKDKLQDAVLVLQQQDIRFVKTQGVGEQAIEYDTNPRILIVLFKNAKEGYTLAECNNTFILRNNNPNRIDPFLAVTINNSGILAIDFHFYYVAGDDKDKMTNATYKFRYQNNNFELIGAEVLDTYSQTGKSVDCSFNFMTRKMCVSTKNLYADTKPVEDWKIFELDKLKSLKALTYPFTWTIHNINL